MKTQTMIALLVMACVCAFTLFKTSSAEDGGDTIVFAADSAGNIFALEVSSGSLLWSASVSGDTRSVAVSDNGEYVAVGTSANVALFRRDGNALWSKSLGVNPTDPAPPFQFDTKLVSISGEGEFIVAAHIDGTVRLYDNKGTETWSNPFSATSVALAVDGRSAAAGGSLGIRYFSVGSNGVWDSTDSTPNWTVGTLSVRKVAISSNGSYVAAGDRDDGYVRLFDRSGIETWNYRNLADRVSVDISRDGRSVVSGNDDRANVQGAQLSYFSMGDDGVWTIADAVPAWTFTVSNDPGDDVRAVAISKNGSFIASGGSATYARTFVHRVESFAPIYNSTQGYEDEAIDISADGNYVVAADTETNAVRLYNTVGLATPLWTYSTTFPVRSVAISSWIRVSDIWVPSAQGALIAGAITISLTSGVSTAASALSSPGDFASSGFARKVNEVFPETLKKWLHEFISSKRKLALSQRTGSPFMLTKMEIISYAVVLSVLTLAFSYAKADSLDQILSIVPTVLATSIVVEFIKSFSIEVLARRQGVWTEHRVWYFGLGTFLFSTFVFKVPFSSPGRLTHHSPKFTKRSLGLVSSASVIIAFVFAVLFYTLLISGYVLIGNIGLVMCLTMVFFDTLPIPPMNGKDIYDWNKILWLTLFVTAFALYMLVLLTL